MAASLCRLGGLARFGGVHRHSLTLQTGAQQVAASRVEGWQVRGQRGGGRCFGGWWGAGRAPGHAGGVATGAGATPAFCLRVHVSWGGRRTVSRGWQRGTWGCPPPRRDLGEQNQQAEGTPRPAHQGAWENTINQTLFHRQRQGPPKSLSLGTRPSLKHCLLTAVTVGSWLAARAALRGGAGGQAGPPRATLPAHGVDAHQCCLGGKRDHFSLPWRTEGCRDGDGGSQQARGPGDGTGDTGSRHGSCPSHGPPCTSPAHPSNPSLLPTSSLSLPPSLLPFSAPNPPRQSQQPMSLNPHTGVRAGTPSHTRCREAGAQGCARGVTPCWPPSPQSRCPSPVTQCAAPADASRRAGLVPSTPRSPQQVVGVLADGACSPRGLTLRGWCWATALPALLLRQDRSIRGGSGSPRGGLAVAGGSSAVAGDRWPRVLPGHGGSLAGSSAALLSAGCLQGEDGP